MLPRTKSDTQLQYWVSSGRSTPRLLLSAFTARCDANGPRMARPGLPGSTWPAKKMMMLKRTSVSIASPKRFSRNLVKPGPLSAACDTVPGGAVHRRYQFADVSCEGARAQRASTER